MYVLDANIFIQSNRRHYGIDFVPAFWDWLDRAFANQLIVSIKPILDEVRAGDDELTEWAKMRPDMFAPIDSGCQPSLGQIADWANGGHCTQAAVAEFLSVADYQLTAYAHAHGHTVVTLELPDPARKKRIKIPDACNANDVNWMDPYEMLRREKVRFTLG